jgi:hypothetical protein
VRLVSSVKLVERLWVSKIEIAAHNLSSHFFISLIRFALVLMLS